MTNRVTIKIIILFLLVTAFPPVLAFSQNIEATENISKNIADPDVIFNPDLNPTPQPNIINNQANKNSPVRESVSKIVNSVIDKKNHLPSIMYSDEESKVIDRALEAYKNKTTLSIDNTDTADITDITKIESLGDNAKSYIYLSSILYRSPTDWSVWINDQKISFADNKFGNELYIKSINPDKADIIWTMSISKWKIIANKQSDPDVKVNSDNQVEFNFSLSFNQTYMLNSDKVVEGKIVPITTLQNPSSNNDELLTND